MIKVTLPLFCCLAFLSSISKAGVINGGSQLLNSTNVSQLESWFGYNIELTTLFQKDNTNSSSTDWHQAVDNQGATLTVFEAITDETTYLIGGYNVQSWNSTAGFPDNYTQVWLLDSSFLFNLDTNSLYRRSRNGGSTYNDINYGATFGEGHDLYVNSDLSEGTALLGSQYGNIYRYGHESYNVEFAGGYNFTVGKYETFAVTESQQVVSEPSNTIPFLTAGLFSLLILNRKRNRNL